MGKRLQLWSRKRSWEEALGYPVPPLPPAVIFKPKYNLPVLGSYEGVFKASYWAKWKKRPLKQLMTGVSWVSPTALRDLTVRAGLDDMSLVEKVCSRLELGARLGV